MCSKSTRFLAFAILAVAGMATLVAFAGDDKAAEAEKARVGLVKACSGAKVSLVDAINIAIKETKGIAVEAEFAVDKDGKAWVGVGLLVGDKLKEVDVDSMSGKVLKVQDKPMAGEKAAPRPAERRPAPEPRKEPAPMAGQEVTTPSGLKYIDLKVGDGPMPSGPTAEVTVHYTGWFEDGTKFDSSVDRGEPTTLALNRFIAGWAEGVGSMKVGGKRKLIIPSNLGYGERGQPPRIPPQATLIFEVDLLATK